MAKIILINTDLPYGGGAMMIVWLANALAKGGFDVSFLTYRSSTQNYLRLDERINVIELGTEMRGHSLSEMVKTVRRLRKVLKNNDYDLGIAFLSPSQLRLGLASIGTHTKVLLSHRADPFLEQKSQGLKSKILDVISRYLFCHADGYVFQTEMARDYFSERIKAKSIVIPNPVRDIRRTEERTLSRVEKRIVNVARLDVSQKRQDLLLEAFKRVTVKHPDYLLEFYGDGPDEKMLREMSAGYDNIVFCGVTTNVVESIQHAAMSVLASDFEGIPNVVLEAMSLSVPCISTDCSPGGAAMLIESGVNGLLVPRNDVEALANAMCRFIEDKEFAEQCGSEGTKVRERFSEKKIADNWMSYIQSLTDEQ